MFINVYYNQLHGLCNPEVQCRIHKCPPIISILSEINSIPRIDNYFFKIHSNTGLPEDLLNINSPTLNSNCGIDSIIVPSSYSAVSKEMYQIIQLNYNNDRLQDLLIDPEAPKGSAHS